MCGCAVCATAASATVAERCSSISGSKHLVPARFISTLLSYNSITITQSPSAQRIKVSNRPAFTLDNHNK
jgi:hypothetical protein